MNSSSNVGILTVLKSDKKSFDEFSSSHIYFFQLNPPVQRLLAPGTSVERAGTGDLRYIQPTLKEIYSEAPLPTRRNIMRKKTSEFNSPTVVPDEKIIILDARGILDSGKDPMPEIMKILVDLGDKTLLIINSFEPIPLIELLKRKGFEFVVEKKCHDLFYTYFKNSDQKTQQEEVINQKKSCYNLWEETLIEYKNKIKVLNVKDLEMPWPMIQVLNALTQMDPGNALHILHRKIPYLLLNELSKRGYACKIKEEVSNVQLLIFKEK